MESIKSLSVGFVPEIYDDKANQGATKVGKMGYIVATAANSKTTEYVSQYVKRHQVFYFYGNENRPNSKLPVGKQISGAGHYSHNSARCAYG